MPVIFQKLFFILASLSALGVAGLAVLIFRLNKKIKIILGGNEKAAGSEVGLQKDLLRRLTKAEIKMEQDEPRLKILEHISKVSVQKTGFMRFNPFQDTGGDQSFVIALLDRELNGIILSSLYSREGTRLYGKEIQKGVSQHPLSDEERKVLEETIQK